MEEKQKHPFSIHLKILIDSNMSSESRNKKFAYLVNEFKWNYFSKLVLLKFPLNIDIEASSACELKCDHCFRQYNYERKSVHEI